MYNAQEVIKGKFWIVNSAYGEVGTLRKTDEAYEFFDQTNSTKKLLDSPDELFKFSSTDRDNKEEQDELKVNGFPTGSTTAVEDVHDVLPVFRKTITSKTLHGAGYYIVKFEGMGWQWAFAPKLSTLDKYKYEGPYLTEWEMNLELRRKKRDPNEEYIKINRDTSPSS